MSKKLYVGNLPYSMTDDELRDTFSKAGTVEEAAVLKDPTGRSRGFGFVTMDDEGAQKAIETLNEQDMGGRKLVVNEARPKTDRPRRSFGGGGGFGGGRGGYGGGGGYDRGSY
ncbi:MAG: hypothetical protein A3J46_00510 [Candidatus Yanofskybacteria bacterium RIFCSPHIGHO2_02_FULL_41_11]|uniref:RRM domain-containing protein n=1 Tax=Candidatus Yanofskybacteria bacterium RIFCSPHIGHO2_02_FULL_41_11 TaxID=1802675 RepID=A0A1F8FAG8_9BACT|nr:MAG: hypothetical protein A3J46_00510 [Candidatus Yanofskybacteria bacterium RIFCSPHIGHO2_02_FULL_41_11]